MTALTEHIRTHILPQDEELLCYWIALLMPVIDINCEMAWAIDYDCSSDAVLAFKIKGCPDFETLIELRDNLVVNLQSNHRCVANILFVACGFDKDGGRLSFTKLPLPHPFKRIAEIEVKD